MNVIDVSSVEYRIFYIFCYSRTKLNAASECTQTMFAGESNISAAGRIIKVILYTKISTQGNCAPKLHGLSGFREKPSGVFDSLVSLSEAIFLHRYTPTRGRYSLDPGGVDL